MESLPCLEEEPGLDLGSRALPAAGPGQTQERSHELGCVIKAPEMEGPENGEMASEARRSRFSVAPPASAALGLSRVPAPERDGRKTDLESEK